MNTRILRPLLIITAGAFVCMFFFISISRISYPYELEWMEGAIADHVIRLLNGQSIYVEPSPSFVPFIYTPFYYVVGAVATVAFGIHFWVLRLISLLATCGTFSLIYYYVYNETNSKFYGVIATGFYVAAFAVTGGWYDLARVDSLFIFLLMSAFVMLSTSRSGWVHLFSGLCFTLACFTKQTALPIVIVLFVVKALTSKGRLRWLALFGFLSSSTVFFLYYQLTSAGWFWFYTISLPQQHYFHLWTFINFLWSDILSIALIGGIGTFVACVAHVKRREYLFPAFFITTFLVSALARMHSGGFDNVLIPVFLSLSIGLGLGLYELQQTNWQQWLWQKFHLSFLETHSRFTACIHFLLLFQFLILIYNPMKYIPTKADRIAGDQFMTSLSDISGEVFLPYHGFYLTQVDKPMQAHYMALIDVLRGKNEAVANALWDEFITNIESRTYSAVILDEFWLKDELSPYYQLTKSPFQQVSVFTPVTGHQVRPEFVYIPTKQ